MCTASRRPIYGTPAARGPIDISHGISVLFMISAARYVITFVAGELVVRYLLHTYSNGISLHNTIV